MYGGRAPKGELCNKVCMYVCMYVLSPHEVTDGDCPCIRQFHTLCFKYMSHQGALSPNNSNTVQVSLPSPISFYVPFPQHISKLGVFGCTLYRDDDVSLLQSRNKTWLSSSLLYFRHWTNHA